MKAVVWHGASDVRVERVPDPTILNPRDAIVRITTTAICGSDLHLFDGYIPTMQAGDILGHEFMGEVVEAGRANRTLAVAVWGCGPVGQFAIRSAYLLGAARVIGIDSVPARLRLAAQQSGADTINFEEEDVFDHLKMMTGGMGPDACIDAVGLEAHGAT